MILWQTKKSIGGTYETQKSPSSYKISFEDLDKKSYRSVITQELIDSKLSGDWAKLQFSYNYVTEEEVQKLLPLLATNPLYVKVKCPVFGNEYQEYQVRCSKKSVDMNEDHSYTLSFNLVQKKKVAGQ